MRLFFLIPVLLYPLYSISQISDQQGEVRLKNGEVIPGRIFYSFNENDIIFITDSSQVDHSRFLKDVESVRLQNSLRYVSRSEANSSVSDPVADSEGYKLLKVIVAGPGLSLYESLENPGRFYVEKDDKVYPLQSQEVVKTSADGKSYSYQDEKYISILRALLRDKPELFDQIARLDLNEKELKEFVILYNAGEVSYITPEKKLIRKEPNFLLFAQASRLGSLHTQNTVAPSLGFGVGSQIYFNKSGRFSVRVSIEYFRYSFQDEDRYGGITDYRESLYGLSHRVQYDFIKNRFLKVSGGVQVFEFGYGTFEAVGHEGKPTEQQPFFYPRFSPYIGADVKIYRDISLFAEINHLLNLRNIPASFTIGFNFDI